MKISGLGSSGSASTKRTEKSKGVGGVFASHLKGSTDSAEAAGGPDSASGLEAAASLSGLEGLLAAQSVSPDAGGGRGRQRMIRHGEDLLDRLEEVRRGLLLGGIPKARLAELAQMVRSKRDTGVDPHLSAILDEIELRAEVELAKLTRRS